MEVNVSWYQVNELNAAKKFYGEVLGLKEAAKMLGVSEPVFRHRLSAARSKMM